MGRERLFGWLESEHLTVFPPRLEQNVGAANRGTRSEDRVHGLFFLIAQLGRKAERHGENGRRRASVLREGRESPRHKLQKFCRVPPPVFPHLELDARRKRPRDRLFLSTFNFVKFIPC